MIDLQFFTDLAYAALAVLVAVLAIYLAVRLLGKFAKFLITVVIIVFVIWFLFSDHSVMQYIWDLLGGLKDQAGGALDGVTGFLPKLSELFGK